MNKTEVGGSLRSYFRTRVTVETSTSIEEACVGLSREGGHQRGEICRREFYAHSRDRSVSEPRYPRSMSAAALRADSVSKRALFGGSP